ncbi:MAG: prolipoprotein diacylglyceryl transferase [Candidatus Sumerlaeaceae bacterium]
MLTYPSWITPDLLHLGKVRVRWYGIMYLLGFLVGRLLLKRLCRRGFIRLNPRLIDDFLVVLFAGMVIGARIIYMMVYYRASPDEPFIWYWTPFAVWEGGLAFHGAVIGMCLGTWLFARWHKLHVWNLTDALALAGSQGIIFGRIGNFINAELPGRVTESAMGMQFPVRWNEQIIGYTEPRHPSQLYEAVGEGLIPFALIWLLKPYVRYEGILGALWLCFYAVARFFLEFFREKDAQLGYYFGWMTMGQILCAAMFAVGLLILLWNRYRAVPIAGEVACEEPPAPAAAEA